MFLFLWCYISCTFWSFDRAAWADDKKLFFLSPTIDWYFPTSGKVRDAFGSAWMGFGVSLNMEAFGWQESSLKIGGVKFFPYMGYFHADEGDNDAYIIPLGLETRWTLREQDDMRFYLGLGLSGYGVKFDDRSAGVDSGWKAAFGGRVLLGMDVTRWLNIHAAYNAITDVSGYDFGGFSAGAKIKIYF